MSSAGSVCSRLISNLQELFNETNVDLGHNIDHALSVSIHVKNALAVSSVPKLEMERDAVLYASLLHDADDRKFFPNSTNNENARRILKIVIPDETEMHKLIIKMINLVSCSENGDSTGDLAENEMWMLIPRIADRLEASGSIGILRAWIYSEHTKRPLWLDTTPRAHTIEDLEKIATLDRYDKYLIKKDSDSMIDHIYDKIFHILSPQTVQLLNNPYFIKEAHERHSYIVQFVLNFGKTGKIDIRNYNKILTHSNAKTKILLSRS